MKEQFKRHVSIQDLLSVDTRRLSYGLAKGILATITLIIGDVKVGKHTWIGPNVVLDGSGGLEIGDFVSISAGVQIYSHDTVEWSNSMGKIAPKQKQTVIGNGVYLGPNSVVQMGVHIRDKAVIGAMRFVNKDVPENAKWYGKSLVPGN